LVRLTRMDRQRGDRGLHWGCAVEKPGVKDTGHAQRLPLPPGRLEGVEYNL